MAERRNVVGRVGVPVGILEHLETPSRLTLYGAKGCADGSVVPAPAAIANAVSDALHPLGIAVNELPVTPARLWRRLREAERR